MGQAAGKRKSEMAKRVLDDIRTPHAIDHRKVEPYLCQLAFRHQTQILRGGGVNAPHLRRAQPLYRLLRAARRLDLAEHDLGSVAQDQVDLPTKAAPARLQ